MRNLKNKEQVEATREANATAVVAYGLAGRGASSRRLSEEDESTVDIDQPPGLAKRPRPASAGAGFEALAGKLIDLNADSNTIRARLAQTDEQRLALAEKKHDDDKTERARLAAEQKEERERAHERDALRAAEAPPGGGELLEHAQLEGEGADLLAVRVVVAVQGVQLEPKDHVLEQLARHPGGPLEPRHRRKEKGEVRTAKSAPSPFHQIFWLPFLTSPIFK